MASTKVPQMPGVGAALPLPRLAAAVPASFFESGGSYELKRGAAKLWGIDERLLDLTQGGRIKVENNGRRLSVKGFLAGINIEIQLAISINDANLEFSSNPP